MNKGFECPYCHKKTNLVGTPKEFENFHKDKGVVHCLCCDASISLNEFLDCYKTREEKSREERDQRKDVRIEALKKLGGKCRDCGNIDRRVFEIHHIKWIGKTRNESPTVLLCANCHRIRHYNIRATTPKKNTDEQLNKAFYDVLDEKKKKPKNSKRELQYSTRELQCF